MLSLEIGEADLARGERDLRFKLSGASKEPCRYEKSNGLLRMAWSWGIDFYAGEITLDILDGETLLWTAVLDVRPHGGKLGREAYQELIADLCARAANVIFGTTVAQRSVAAAETQAPPIARLAMLQSHIRELERSFAAVTMSPNRRLIADREIRPLDRTRRIDVRALQSIIRSTPALAALGRIDAVADDLAKRPTIDHPRREHTFNTPPNRHIAALVRRMRSDCQELQAEFLRLERVRDDDPEMQARARSLADEAGRLHSRLGRMARADFLQGVEPARGDTAAMVTVAKDPVYSRFDSIARHVLSPRVGLGQSLCEKLWLRRTYELYEYWCLFRVADVLTSMWGKPHSCIGLVVGGLLESVPDKSYLEWAVGNLRARLVYQRTFRAYDPRWEHGSEPFSISGERRPDMILSLCAEGRESLIVLDAKYRCGRDPIHDALGDMHIYRDSLRLSGSGARVVGAYILTPAHVVGAASYYTDEYRRRYGLGGFDLAPGCQQHTEILREHLTSFLPNLTG
jgi:hypothetical protein